MSGPSDAEESSRAGEAARSELKSVFNGKGLRRAVIFLNSLTDHRFTSVYRFDGPTLRSITFYDRENPEVDHCDDLPVLASYCVFVRDLGAPFEVSHAACDERVNGHSKQRSIQRYCGVPLRDSDGKMFGSICHFDLNPGAIRASDVDLLEYLGDLMRSKFAG
jgi:GAF domain-containing protein